MKGDSTAEVKDIRCNNAGENEKLKEVCKPMGIEMEYTAPHTLQMNGVDEQKFVTVWDKAVVMMLVAKLLDGKHCDTLDNAVPNCNVNTSPDHAWYDEHTNILKHLVQWGQIEFVTICTKQPKLENKSVKCVMVGYTYNHSGDTYRVHKPDEDLVILSRAVKWAEWHGLSVTIAEVCECL